MKIVLAPDSFKGNLTSMEVAIAFEKGIKRVLSGANCIKVPMADGGEGTVQSLVDGVGGKFIRKRVIFYSAQCTVGFKKMSLIIQVNFILRSYPIIRHFIYIFKILQKKFKMFFARKLSNFF